MKRTTIFMMLLLGCLSFVWPAAAESADNLAQAQNAFAVDLYAQLREKPGNLFFSPYSIATALEMTFAGAKGDTADEMAKALHLAKLQAGNAGIPLQTLLLQAARQQHRLLNGVQNEGFELHVANALWGQDGYPFNQAYIAEIKDNFGGNLESVNFGNEPSAREKINTWVAEQTKGKIENLILPGMLSTATRLVLTNAIYFKATWQNAFKKGGTSKQRFHVSGGRDVQVDMMHQTDHFGLVGVEGQKILVMPYRSGLVSMLVLLPDKKDGLPELERGLVDGKLDAWLSGVKDVRVALALPKFTYESALGLNDVLKALGMNKAFAPDQADFSGMVSDAKKLFYIAAVLHKAFVAVDEQGTEAAAATAVLMDAAAMPVGEPVPFVADHPFLYLIRDNRTGTILFMGRMTDPTQ